MDAKLSVEVGAKITELQTKMVQAQKSVSDFATGADKSISKTTESVKSGSSSQIRSIEQLKIQLKSYKRVAETAPNVDRLSEYNKKIQSISTQVGQLSNVGKKGFDELGNAINGSTNYATKAFSIVRQLAYILPGIGIAGILGFATEPIIEYISKLDLFKKKIDEITATRKVLASVELKGNQDAQADITNLKLLYSAYQNANLPLKARHEAYSEIQHLYPDYFKNIAFEQTASTKTKKAYDELTNSILATSRARAAADKITENSSRQLSNEQAIADIQKSKLKDEVKAKALRNDVSTGTSAGLGLGSTGNVANAGALLILNNKIADAEKRISDYKTDTNILTARNVELAKNINKELQNGAKITGDPGKEPATKNIKTISDVLKDLSTDLKQVKNDTTLAFGEDITKNITAYKKAIDGITAIAPASEQIGILQEKIFGLNQELLKIEGNKFAANLDKIKIEADIAESILKASKNQKDFNQAIEEGNRIEEQLHNTRLKVEPFRLQRETDPFKIYLQKYQEFEDKTEGFNQGLKNMGADSIGYIGEFFSSLGEAMASGDFTNFGKGILDAFAGFLGQLGQLFIKQGVAEIGFGVAQNLILPGSGANRISGGVGMLAAGAALSIGSGLISGSSSKGKGREGERPRSIPAFATGVQNFRGGMALVGERGPELVNLPIGSEVIPNHRMASFSGSNNVVLNGNFGISLETLYFNLERVRRKAERTL